MPAPSLLATSWEASCLLKQGNSEVRIQRALKLANVDLGCLNVMASPSLFLHFFRQLVFPCSYLIRGTIPTSVLVLVSCTHSQLHNIIGQCLLYNMSHTAVSLVLYAVDKGLRGRNVLQSLLLILLRICSRSVRLISTK